MSLLKICVISPLITVILRLPSSDRWITYDILVNCKRCKGLFTRFGGWSNGWISDQSSNCDYTIQFFIQLLGRQLNLRSHGPALGLIVRPTLVCLTTLFTDHFSGPDAAIERVCVCVCVCVCVRTITFELNDLWGRYLACWFKYEGQSHVSKFTITWWKMLLLWLWMKSINRKVKVKLENEERQGSVDKINVPIN